LGASRRASCLRDPRRDLGAAPLKAGLPGELGGFADVIDVTDETTRTGVQVAKALSSALTMFTGRQGTVRSRRKRAARSGRWGSTADPGGVARVDDRGGNLSTVSR
jgi:hypothetical protein